MLIITALDNDEKDAPVSMELDVGLAELPMETEVDVVEMRTSAARTVVPRLMSVDEISCKNTKSQQVKMGDVCAEIGVSVLTAGDASGVGGDEELTVALSIN